MSENILNILAHPVSVVILSYLLGSLSFAVIVSRFMGLSDPRSYGSKNPGATNVLRSGNKKAAVLTLLFDAVKGWVPVVWVLNHGAPLGLLEGTAAAAGLAAFLGHLYPIFFRFQGGKGVATALGVLMARVFHRSSGRGWRLRQRSLELWGAWRRELEARGWPVP